MSDFFSNLIDRHLGVCDTIQPRIPGRFEMDQATGVVDSSSDASRPVESANGQSWPSPQPPNKVVRQWPQESDSEVSHRESMANNRYPPADPSSVFSIEVPKTAVDESDSTGDSFSSSSLLETDDPSPVSDITEQPAARSNFMEAEGTQRLDIDRDFHPKTITQQRPLPANRTAFGNEHDLLRDEVAQTGNGDRDEVTADRSPLTQPVDKQYLEQTLNQRIDAVLQQLADPPLSSATESAPNGYRNDRGEALTAPPAENSSRLDFATPPEVVTPVVERPIVNAESQHASASDHLPQGEQYHPLEAPAWLSEVTAQLNQHSQQNEAKTEPVINVTIGRVEVRAVQNETVKNAPPSKRPSGVMTLDEYLQRRKGQAR